ncbi:rho guanine nucleotide exchange factor 5 [Ochotona princeps]|uniref:rho guanine nucleotide exchange factor 5 n=1 Tax=Ochotona princeps TaxID=9978 RepID=UPI002714E19B|nr:rho guanine nucleotide exchange factor 5 [Ochotona princeps]
MEAEEPHYGTSIPISAIEELEDIPEALMRSSQIPALAPDAPEGQDLCDQWAEGHRLLMIQPRELRDASDYAAESMSSFPKKSAVNVEDNQENFVAVVSDTPEHQEAMGQSLADEQARTLAPPQLQECPIQTECPYLVPTLSESGSGEEVEFQPEMTSLTLESGQAGEKGQPPPESSQTIFCPPCKNHTTETNHIEDSESRTVRQGEELPLKEVQQSQGQERLLHSQEAQGMENLGQQTVEIQEVETLGGDVSSVGLWKGQIQMVEQVSGQEGEQGQKREQVPDDAVLEGQRERERLKEELDVLNHGEGEEAAREMSIRHQRGPEQGAQRKMELGGPESKRVDSQVMECQNLVEKSEGVTGQQTQGVTEKVMTEEGQEREVVSDEQEPGAWGGDGQETVEEERSEKQEHHGPSTLALVPSEISSTCDLLPGVSYPMAQVPGTQMEPRAVELSPLAPTPVREPVGHFHQGVSLPDSFPNAELPDTESAQDTQEEESEWDKEKASSKETKMVSGNTSVTPSRTLDTALLNTAEVSTITPVSSTSLPSPFPRSEANNLSLCEAFKNPLEALHGFPTTEATMDPVASSTHGPPVISTEAIQHPRRNSFPGSHRTQPTPNFVGMSLSFSHSELPQRSPKPAIYGSVIPRRDRRRGRDCNIISEFPPSFFIPRRDSQQYVSNAERPSSPNDTQLWGSPCNVAFAQQSPAYGPSLPLASIDNRIYEPLPPPPPGKRHGHSSIMKRDVPHTLKRYSNPLPLTQGSGLHDSVKGPLPQVPDPFVLRQHRPLPSTPDDTHHTQTSFSPRLRYNKPLPPTPEMSQPHHSPISSSSSSRIYRPLPPIPTLDPPSEPPPLPPKARGRSRSTHGGLTNSGVQAKPRPVSQDWTASTPPSVGRTSWPPATGRSADVLASTSRSKSEASSGMAFSNMTNFLSPSPPTTPWTLDLQESSPKGEPVLSGTSEPPVRGPIRTAPQEGASGSRRSTVDPASHPEKANHPHLEKASSWPHRRDPGRPPEGSRGQAVLPGEGPNKQKSWNRQGLRRPSILPEGSSDSRDPAMEGPGPSDTIVLREKKPREVMGGFSRRCSRLINTSHLLYQEYSDVILNKEIQSQQRLNSLAETPGAASPRQPRKSQVSSESCLQRLSVGSSGSLWQEIPRVRDSNVLLSMTHEDQKLQEAKFELIVSEASYLRSLHIAVNHFQGSKLLQATMSKQDRQWLFSRLEDVQEVSNAFLSDLEDNLENDIFAFQVCDVVLNHAPDFRRVYLPYVTNQTYQERTFQSLLNSNSGFRDVLEKLESDPICQRLSLKSFLILPFQRITRLKLLLQNILKRTQPGSSEEAEATKAHHVLEELIRDCNNNVQRMRRTEELIYLSQKIEFECKIFPLISQSRWLVKSGELTALEFSVSPGLRRKLNTRPVHLHLFNDCLLLSRPREGGRFLVFDHAPFSSIRGEKCEMKLHGSHKNLFRLFLRHNAQGTQAEFLFRTETQSEKLRWISALAMPREELDLLECYDSPQVQCLRAYKPRENDELALEKADVVMVTQQSNDGWLEGMRLSDGERGWFPLQQVEFISNSEVRAQNLKEAHRVKTAKLQLVEHQP